jgi:Transposase zinc-binding domain
VEAHQLTIQRILQEGDDVDERQQLLPGSVRRAVQARLACRTALRGGHVQACPEGHLARIWDHACRHRMCPPWAWLPIERWLVIQKARL